MPRPKGSKNRKNVVITESVEIIDEKIAAAESAITALTEELKAKKAELKELTAAREAAERVAAEKKAEEDKARIMEAIAASGVTVQSAHKFNVKFQKEIA